MQKNYALLPFLMWLLPLSFFTYQFILRLLPSLMMQQFMQQFDIDATAFGFLASVYYYGYAGMQIPTAALLDRYGARSTICFSAALCGLATLTFGYTSNWYLALLSRFFIGVGSAAGFLGTSKVISQWFSKDQYAKMVGFSFSIGLMGAIFGGKPTSLLIEQFGWQAVEYALALISLLIGILNYLFLRAPERNIRGKTEKNPLSLKDFFTVLRSPTIWFLGVANLLMVGSLEGFADVWGVNYLMALYHFTKSDAAQLVSFIFIGMLFGGPLLAILSRKLGNYAAIILCGFGIATAFLPLLSAIQIDWYGIASIFFFIGILCCYQVLIFAVGNDLVSNNVLGITVAFLNCMNMLGGSFFHTTIGAMMDMFWAGTIDKSGRVYTVISYQYSLIIIPVCAILGASIIMLVAKNKRKKLL